MIRESRREPFLWRPVHGEKRGVAVLHPVEITALEDLRCQAVDLRILLEILTRRESAAHQKRGVDRGKLTLLFTILQHACSLTGLDVHPMKEPAVLLRGVVGEETQRIADARAGFVLLHPPALGADTQGRKPEAGHPNAADVAAVWGGGPPACRLPRPPPSRLSAALLPPA